MTISFGGASSLSASPHGVYTLEDEDSREELHCCTLAQLQMKLDEPLIQDADGDDSDSGLPDELQTTGLQHIVEYGTVHKSSIPIEVIQKLPFIIIQEKDLPAELLKEQWELIREASQLGDLQEMRKTQEMFVQRFHFKHAAIQGMFRFMDDIQHYKAFNPGHFGVDVPVGDSEEASLHGFTDKEESSSEHYGTERTPSLSEQDAVPKATSVSFVRNSAGSMVQKK
jgi:hypothetical protein